jgi:hypothetical protein
MATTASKHKSKPTYAISYGLGGGPAHSRQLEHHLRQVDLLQASGFDQADIIIAHSGGCWLIPATAKPRLVIYIGMPLAQLQPRQTWLAAKKLTTKHSRRARRLTTMAKNVYYILRQPHRNVRMIRRAKTAQPVAFSDCSTVFIANRHDPWPKDEQIQAYLDHFDWAFINLPGAHDDIWEHPERYATVINHYARLLV